MNNNKFHNIAVVGDNLGVPKLLEVIPEDLVKCIIGASARPQYLDELKKIADKICIPLLVQPKKNTKEYSTFFKNFTDLKIDMLICLSYSMKIRDDILEQVNYNAVNTHCSLLPYNRGPNPENWVLIKGETFSGVTIHYMANELDAGDIIVQHKVEVDFTDTWVTLLAKLKSVRDNLLETEIEKVLAGKNTRQKQNHLVATVNHRLNPEYPKIKFDEMDDIQIYNLIRAQVAPLKGAYIENGNERIYLDKFLSLDKVKTLRVVYGH